MPHLFLLDFQWTSWQASCTEKLWWVCSLCHKQYQQKSNTCIITLPETNSSSPLKMNGWKMTCPFWCAYFQVLHMLSFRYDNFPSRKHKHIPPNGKQPENHRLKVAGRGSSDSCQEGTPRKSNIDTKKWWFGNCPAKVVGEGYYGERTHDRESMGWKMYFLSNMAILGIYVKFQEGNYFLSRTPPMNLRTSHL